MYSVQHGGGMFGVRQCTVVQYLVLNTVVQCLVLNTVVQCLTLEGGVQSAVVCSESA